MKERRSRVAEERKREERERLEHFGLLNGKSSLNENVWCRESEDDICSGRGSAAGPGLVDMLRQERGALLFRSGRQLSQLSVLGSPFKLENCLEILARRLTNLTDITEVASYWPDLLLKTSHWPLFTWSPMFMFVD